MPPTSLHSIYHGRKGKILMIKMFELYKGRLGNLKALGLYFPDVPKSNSNFQENWMIGLKTWLYTERKI